MSGKISILPHVKQAQRLSWFKKNKKVTAAILLMVIILFFIFRPKPPKPITIVTVKKGTVIQSVSASGTIFSPTMVNLTFLAGGKLSYVGVKKGDRINKYQVIATLDQRTAQKNLENALIAYSQQRLTFDSTQEANGNRKPVDALNDTMRRLLENNQYDLNKTINSVELSAIAKEQSTLVSPISGIVIRADVTVAGVNIGATTTYTVADPTNLVLYADVDESDISKIKQGQQMNIVLDAYPEETLELTVVSVDFASHTTSTGGTAYTVEAAIPNETDKYKIGMNADTDIIINKKESILTIPLSSLIDDDHIYVQKGKTYEKRVVKLGIQSDTTAQVLSGLSAGEKVALTPDDVEKQFPNLKSK